MRKPQFHTFGDSHSKFGFEQITVNRCPIKIHHLGPKLMFSFGRDRRGLVDLKRYGIRAGDVVIFCFGEIDCRCHVHKFASEWQENIDRNVIAYIAAIAEQAADLQDLDVVVFNAPPPARKQSDLENQDFPFLGSDDQRLAYTTYMNSRISERCHNQGFLFLDVFQQYATTEGFLNPHYSDGNVHICDPLFIVDQLSKAFPAYSVAARAPQTSLYDKAARFVFGTGRLTPAFRKCS